MKLLKGFMLFILVSLALPSCEKNCRCEQEWEDQKTYCQGALVLLNRKCYVAIIENVADLPRGIEFGDMSWEECTY